MLAAGRLGVGAVAAFVLSAVAPLTVGAGVVPTAYAVTGVVGLPVAFLAVAAVLAVFAAGYLAMARRLPGAGAFYVFIARGLGRPSGVQAVFVLAVLAFVGFEAAVVFSAEARDPRRTVPAATYLALGVMAVIYTLASWALTVATGPDRIVAQAQAEGPDLLFRLAGAQLGGTAGTIGRALFATSLLAALLSFHAAVSRYGYSIARDGVLPRGLARVSSRTGAPIVASLTQNVFGLAVIVLYAVMGWDPLVQLFFWAGGIGGLSVLVLLVATSVAVVAWFVRHPDGESGWRRVAAPVLATLALGAMLTFALANLDTLLGVPPGDPLTTAVPVGLAAVAILGAGWALLLRALRPDLYAGIARSGTPSPSAGPTGSAR